MFKNVAATFRVFAFDATTGLPKSGDAANITAYVSKDYGTVTVLGDTSAAEEDATNAKGYYIFTAAQAETNADCLMVSGKSSTANVVVIGAPAVIYTRPTTGWLAPATAGRTLVVDASGLADANVVKLGPTGSGTAQTARDIGASVLLSSGTGTGQVTLTSGRVNADITHIATAAVSTSTAQLGVNVVNFGGSAGTFASGIPAVNATQLSGSSTAADNAEIVFDTDFASNYNTTADKWNVSVTHYGGTAGTFSSGRPEVNTSHWGGTAIASALVRGNLIQIAGSAVDATAAQLGVNVVNIKGSSSVGAAGYVGFDWSAINAPTTTVDLSGTTIAITQKVDLNTIKTQAVTCSGGVTVPAATLASTTNITAGTITTATNVTTVNGLAAGVITAAAIADGAIDRATFAADTGLQTIRSNTAQAGAAGSITLDASASSVTDFYDHCTVYITGGTGVGQHRIITAYNGTTKVATVDVNWSTTPDNTSTFAIMHGKVDLAASSAVVSADISTIAGQTASASDTVNFDLLVNLDAAVSSRMATYTQPTGFLAATFPTTVASTTNITAGTITTTTNLTNLPAITSNWLTATGLATSAVDEIVDAVWDEVQSGHTTAGTFGKYLDAQVSTVGGGTAAQIADAVWDEAIAGHLTAGSTGLKLNSAAAAGDPLENDVPGSYAAGTAGYVLGTIGAGDITMTNPVVDSDNNFTIIKGDDYYAADAREVEWTSASWPSLTSATIYFKAMAGIFEYQTTTGTASGSGTQVVTVNIPTSFTSNLLAGEYQYDLEAVLSNGHIVTLAQGTMTILAQVE